MNFLRSHVHRGPVKSRCYSFAFFIVVDRVIVFVVDIVCVIVIVIVTVDV